MMHWKEGELWHRGKVIRPDENGWYRIAVSYSSMGYYPWWKCLWYWVRRKYVTFNFTRTGGH